MKHLGTQVSILLVVVATALVSLLVGVAIETQIRGNRIVDDKSQSLGMPIPGVENVDEMIKNNKKVLSSTYVYDSNVFRNDEYRFIYRASDNWTVDEERSKENSIVFDTTFPESRAEIIVEEMIDGNKPRFPLEEGSPENSYYTSYEEVYVDGIKGYKYTCLGLLCGATEVVYENKIYYLSQIQLDDFEFIKSTDTSDCKSYEKHDASGLTACIVVNPEVSDKLFYKDETFLQERIDIIDDDGKASTLYTIPEKWISAAAHISNYSFSPNGNYLHFTVTAYEHIYPNIYSIAGDNIIDGVDVNFGKEDLFWSENEELLVINSIKSDFGGEGEDGLFVSEVGRPEILENVFPLTTEQHWCGSSIKEISVDENLVKFSTWIRERVDEQCSDAVTNSYSYNALIKELSSL